MISIPVAIAIALTSALLTWAFLGGKAMRDLEANSAKIEELTASVVAMGKDIARLTLELERVKWITGPHHPFRGHTGPGHAPSGE